MNSTGLLYAFSKPHGFHFDPFDFHDGDVSLYTIARVLSRTIRFHGHCPVPYTVAQHCVECSRRIEGSVRLKMMALLHDAGEAYLFDCPRPLVARVYLLDTIPSKAVDPLIALEDLEVRVLQAIYRACGVPEAVPLATRSRERAAIGEIDDRMLATEVRDLWQTEAERSVLPSLACLTRPNAEDRVMPFADPIREIFCESDRVWLAEFFKLAVHLTTESESESECESESDSLPAPRRSERVERELAMLARELGHE